MVKNTRTLIFMHKVVHPSDDIERLIVSREGEGRELANIEDCVRESLQGFEEYIKTNQDNRQLQE